MAVKVVFKGKEVGPCAPVVVDGYYEMTVLEFIAERVNDYRKRDANNLPVRDRLPYKIRTPSRPEPEIRKV